MSRPTPRCRRLIAVGAAVLALGTAGHAACQAIEHHDGARDAVALCAAAVVALIVTLRMAAGGRTTRLRVPLVRPFPGRAGS
jgi:hypothetical protein